jgi:activator of HSP90 ATPase
LHSSTPAKEPVRALVKKSLVPQIRKSLATLAPTLIAEHGKDLQHPPGSGPPTGYTTPVNKTASSNIGSLASKPSATTSTTGTKSINTVHLSTTTEFRTSAEELFTTFTDPGRITAFTRSPPRVFEGAKAGGKFALFGGGVSGEYVSLKEPTQIVQSWRLAHWPEGHHSKLTLDFDQDDVNSVTNMRCSWDKVPVGEEDSTRDKWEEYYVRSLKTTFGYVLDLITRLFPSRREC